MAAEAREEVVVAVFVWSPTNVAITVTESGMVTVTTPDDSVEMRPDLPWTVFRALVVHVTQNQGLASKGRDLIASHGARPSPGGGF